MAQRRKSHPANSTRTSRSMMRNEFTAVVEPASEGGFWAVCPEVPGANGQGETIEECRQSLREAISLILQDRPTEGAVSALG